MSRLNRAIRVIATLLLAGLAGALVVGAASSSPPMTIGQTDSGANFGAGTAGWFLQTGVAAGADFVVPPGDWIVTGWSTYAKGSGAQSMSMMIFRPDGFGHYTVVGESPVEALTPGSSNTFADVDLPVQAGDRLGLYDPTGDATVATMTGAAGDGLAFGITATEPAVGALVAPSAVLNDLFRLNISAELSPAEPEDSIAPTTSIGLSPPAPNGDHGWYTEPVAVSVEADDGAGSGVAATRCVVDPAISPGLFGDMASFCPYLGAGPDVGSDGHHAVYAASEDIAGNDETPVSARFKIDQTPPTVTCGAATAIRLGSADGAVTATVGDAGSGPVSASASATVSTAVAGAHTIDVTGQDEAGNTATVPCGYVIGYVFGGFDSPLPKATVKSGSTLPLKFQLKDASGQPIGDTEAQSLISPSCKIAIAVVRPAGPVSGCPGYEPTTKQFQLNLKTTPAMVGANGVSVTVTLDGTVVTNGAVEPFTVK
jgi:hypothetical protein